MPDDQVMYERRARFMCEGENDDGTDCNKPATTEWTDSSEYNDPDEIHPMLYQTYRCDDHPVNDRDYHPKEIYQ